MARKIQMLRINEERAEKLREKAIELTIERKEIIKESTLVNFLIDEFTEKIDMDRDGLFINEEKEK